MPGTTASTTKKVAAAKEAATHGGKTPQDKATDGAEKAPTGKAHAAAASVVDKPAADKAHAGKARGDEKAHAGKAHGDEKAAGKGHANEKPAAKAPARHEAAARKSADGYAGDHKFLESQRKALLAERSTYVEQAESLRAEADSLVEEMEPGDIQFDEESGEGGTVTVDRERDLALSAQALVAVEEIDHALAKIDLGSYGICEGCGTLIPKNRLDALPYARLCIACKSGGLSRR
jgi:DnaK suppressor protein